MFQDVCTNNTVETALRQLHVWQIAGIVAGYIDLSEVRYVLDLAPVRECKPLPLVLFSFARPIVEDGPRTDTINSLFDLLDERQKAYARESLFSGSASGPIST